MALPPIIKIKRGNGLPPVWNGSAGITAGEFAFDKDNNVLYLGASGGFCGIDATGALISNNDWNVIPVGMQISNDVNFGSGGELNTFLGYSDYTVPTTRAVREYVNYVKGQDVLGITLYAGPGIAITFNSEGDIVESTITNIGVIKGFTGISVTNVGGNAFGNPFQASSAVSGLTLSADSGIQLQTNGNDSQIIFTNIGVTGIAGYTGNIQLITPITGLSGYTVAVGKAMQELLVATNPIIVSDRANGVIDISHATSSAAGIYEAVDSITNVPQLHSFVVNSTGHITNASSTPLDFGNIIPPGFTEAVQDAAYPGITSGQNINYGIEARYNDNVGLVYLYNRGITSISAGSAVGLSGAVKIFPGNPDISVQQNVDLNTINISYVGNNFSTVTTSKASSVYPNNTGIYAGGFTGPGSSQFIAADTRSDSFALYAGRGIGISAGQLSASNDGILLWNAGINTITIKDDQGTIVGVGGISGNMEIQAGSNILLTRGSGTTENTLIISSTAGGEGGAIGEIKADYADNDTTYTSTYIGPGVTGLVDITGRDGIITRQSVATPDGTISIGLHSQVKVPSGIFPVGFEGFGPGASIEITTQKEYAPAADPPEISDPNGDAYYNLNSKAFGLLQVDKIIGGFTGTLGYDGGNNQGPYDPNFTADEWDNSVPGKILILAADSGYIWDGQNPPAVPTVTGKHAEVRLLSYPNPENLGAELQRVWFDDGSGVGGCPGNVCAGFPPVTPECAIDINGDGVLDAVRYGTSDADMASVAIQGNILARNSIFVNDDIWLNGEIIDAKTGCLWGGGGGGGGVSTPGGNLGLSGDLIVDGSIYVHGGTAFFNVNNLSTESPLLRMGGLSASSGYSEEMLPVNTGTPGYTGDRGLVLFHYSRERISPLNNTSNASASPKTGFIGIDSSEGMFAYYQNAEINKTDNFTHVINGSLGPAKFREINNVGITADDTGNIYLKTTKTPDNVNPTINTPIANVKLNGDFEISGPPASDLKPSIFTFGPNARLHIDNRTDSVDDAVRFSSGLTFDRTQNANNPAGVANSPFIQYFGAREIYIPTAPTSQANVLVHTGRSATSTGLANGNYHLTSGQYNDLTQQVLYNKTLSEGTIIDCGTY